jgi:acyl-CoA synthetase (AMP-forming)/AMP-acid ligase II
VIRREGATVEAGELISWIRERVSHYKCPKEVRFVADLGRTAAGKINKKRLRAPFWEDAKK